MLKWFNNLGNKSTHARTNVLKGMEYCAALKLSTCLRSLEHHRELLEDLTLIIHQYMEVRQMGLGA